MLFIRSQSKRTSRAGVGPEDPARQRILVKDSVLLLDLVRVFRLPRADGYPGRAGAGPSLQGPERPAWPGVSDGHTTPSSARRHDVQDQSRQRATPSPTM